MLIGVDHGNKQIKTAHGEPFVSGLQQSLTRPFGQSLQYRGTYYTLSNERIPFHKDKTEDDRFFALTLIAIAEENYGPWHQRKRTAPYPAGRWPAPGTFWCSVREIRVLFSGPWSCRIYVSG